MNQPDRTYIENRARQYVKGVLFLLIGITLTALAYMNISVRHQLLWPIIISLTYNAVISILFICIWKTIMANARESAVHLYLGATGGRLVTAMFVILTYCLLEDSRPTRLMFALTFCSYYLIMLVFDTVFFIKTEGQLPNKK